MSRPYLLLPPSEGKAAGGVLSCTHNAFGQSFDRERERVRRSLQLAVRTSSSADVAKLLGVKGKLLEAALAQTRTLGSAKCLYLPAWQRFVGVVWQYLEPQTLSSQHRKQILIPNALYGLTRADDDIADFRLKFSVRLEDIGRLDHYWREAVSGQLRTLSRRALLVNLLPAEHSAVIKDVDHVAHVSFVTADGVHAAGHAAKAVKGMVARAILKDGEQILNSFSWQGWRSTKTESGWCVAAPRSSQP